jgi:ketosteroid isomerase-like protein
METGAIMDHAAEVQRLLDLDSEWSKLSSAGQDIEGILRYWADDGVVYAPGMPPVVGKDALREYVRASLGMPGFKIEWAAQRAVLSDDGSLGYTTGTNVVTMDGEDGQPVTQEGRFLAVWRKNGDAYQCVEDVLIATP